jgi:hypothetical protein
MRATLIAALIALTASSVAQALSIGRMPPHKSENACPLVAGLFRQIIAGKTEPQNSKKMSIDDLMLSAMSGGSSFFSSGLSIITDDLGKVSADEMPALTSSLSSNDGKPDSRPAKLEELRLIAKSEQDPLYIAVLSRDRWENFRYTDMDGMGQSETLSPGYEEQRSFWIVQFSSNRIMTLREADETYTLAYRNEAPNVCR